MPGATVGSVSVDVVPNASRFAEQLRASIVPQAGTLGEEIGRQISDRIAASIRSGIQNGFQGAPAREQGSKTGQEYGDEFSRVVKTRIEAALRSLPTVQIGVATSEADQKLRDLTARLQALQHQTIGVDIAGTEALAEIDKIKADLASLARNTPDVKVRVDALAAIAQLKVVREEIARLEAKPAEVRVVAKDEFSTIIRTKVEAAAASLPEIQIGVATTAAEQKLRDLHVRLEELRDKRVGVDIDAKDALAEVDKIRVQLDRLAQKSPDIQVRVDAARAVAELAAVKAEVDKLDRQHADVKVDSSAASAGISGLVAGIAAIGPALIPIAAVAAAGLGAVSTVAVAGAAGVGVLALALHGVSAAVTAVNAEQASAATDAKAYATAQASAAAAVEGAQASLANAVRSADNSSINSAQAVQSARTGLAKAIESADNSTISSAQAVQKAQQSLANAIESADNAAISSAQAVETARTGLANAIASADNAAISSAEAVGNAQQALDDSARAAALSVTNALQAEDNAETSLAQALQQEQVAQDALTAARKTAQQQIEDLTLSVQDGALSQRSANLAVETSKINLDKVLANPKSSELQRDQAQLTYDQAVQHVTDLGVHQDRLQTKQAQAVQAGVDGSAVVITAQDRIATSVRAVGTAQDNVAKTQAAVVEAQRAGLEKIGNAQQHLADSQRAQDTQARTSAQAVAAAQQTLSNAIRAQGVQAETSAHTVEAAQQSVTNAIRAQGVQAKTSAESVTAAQQAVSNALRAQDQQAVSSAASVAAAQRALENAERAQKTAADQVSSSAQAAQKALADLTPAGREFVTFIVGTMQPALKKLQETAAAGLLPGLQSGLANLIPIMPTINEAVGKLAKAMGDLFAAAGKALDSPFYRKFITFIGDEGSKTLTTFGQIIGNLVTGFSGLLIAFAPFTDAIGEGLLKLSKKFADFGTNTDPNSPLQKFIAYVKEVGPTVIDTFKQLGIFIGHIVEALTTYGGGVLKAIDATLKFLNKFSPAELAGVLAGAAILFAALNPGFGSVALAISAGTIALTAFYDSNKGFHDYVDQILSPALKKFADNYGAVSKASDDGAKSTDNASNSLSDFGKMLTRDVLPALGTALGIFGETTKQAVIGVVKDMGSIVDFFKFSADTLKGDFQFLADRWDAFTHAMATGYDYLGSDVADVNKNLHSGWADLQQLGLFLAGDWDSFTATMRGAWHFLGSDVQDVSNNLKGFWADLGQALNFLKGDFDSFVTSAGQIWDKMKELTAKPINFVINTILNDGLIKGFNAVTSLINIPAVPNIPPIPGYAGGGALHGPGTGTSDEILMYGSNNEHVVTEREVQGAGGHAAVEAQRKVWAENYANGGPITMKQVIPQFADGGPVTWPAMLSIIQGQFPDALDTSDYRPGDPGYHGKSEALDIGFAGNDRSKLLEADKWIASNYSNSTQLIHQGGVNIAFGQDKGDGVGYYGAQTMAEHDTHVHWANDRDPHLNSGNVFSGIANSVKGAAGAVVQSLRDTVGSAFDAIVSPIGSLIGSKFKAPPVVNGIPQAFFDTEKGKVRDFITGKADAKSPAGAPGGNYTGPIPGGDAVGRWRGLVDSTLTELGLNVGLDDKVLRQIALESSGDPNATQGNIGDVNNASGDLGRGLMQVIGTTFRDNAGPYVGLGQYDPHASIYAGLNYDSHKFGGNRDLSDLGQGHGYDSGGWLKPGDVGMNFTGRPEAVLTPDESAGLKAGLSNGGAKTISGMHFDSGSNVYITNEAETHRLARNEAARLAAAF